MKLIKPSYQIIEQESGLKGIYKQIELAGRTCYRSEPVEGITSEEFVNRLIKMNHLSVLEHGTVYLKIKWINSEHGIRTFESLDMRYSLNKHSKVVSKYIGDSHYLYITSNLRVLQENSWLADLKYLCEPTEYHEKRVTVRFTSNIHFYKDLTRHRKMSYAIESTRYCNYSKNRFNSQLTFISPVWTCLEDGYYGIERNIENSICSNGYFFFKDNINISDEEIANATLISDEYTPFILSLYEAEQSYLKLIELGWTAQQAAEVLPQATKADIICTGFIEDWKHIFNLRTSIIAATGKPHPEVSRLMDPLYKEFKERKYI